MKFEQRKVEGDRRNAGKQGVIRAVNESRKDMCERVAGDYSKGKIRLREEDRNC